MKQAVVGGTSLGANVTLEAAAAAPERVKGMLIEMPVLDNALLGCAHRLHAAARGPHLRRAGRAPRWAAGARLVPRGNWLLGDMLLDWVSQDPKPSASVLQGLFYGRVAPPREERAKMTQQTLVIGHYRDPIHPFSDSDMLVRELPNARLVEASSILELRLTPERLTNEIVEFVERCFKPAPKTGGAGAGRRGPRRGASSVGDLASPFTTFRRRVPPQRAEGGAAPRARGARAPGAAAEQRKKMVGYGAAAVLAIAVVVVAISCSPPAATTASSGAGNAGDVLPGRRQRPRADGVRRGPAAKAAGCELETSKGSGAATTPPILDERVKYNTNPPTTGRHYEIPAEDGIYGEAPQDEQLVHTLEHGRVIIWVKPSLPENAARRPQGDGRRRHVPDGPRAADEHAVRGGGHRLERRSGAERHRPCCSATR